MLEFDKEYVESILSFLDQNSCLFPQFELKEINNELQLLGTGGFSSVYEMCNKERPDISYALKVIGFQHHTVTSEEFWTTGRIQWILCQESKYIMRVLDAKELVLVFDDTGKITEVKDALKEEWEEEDKNLHLQFVLMEKLEKIIEKDRFGNVKLCMDRLNNEEEVLKFALEIGQALTIAHNNKCLHRDIKIENIFWDSSEKTYKLGDFGIAKWAEDGNAETIVYTDGYGAPEIERRLYDYYNATADIYSFGITLYLLLNELRFPGSDGYYSKVQVQYNPDFVFPAPINASEEMARIIRKMCSYYAEDRYQSMNEVLVELSLILDRDGGASEELIELADIATETFSEDKMEKENDIEAAERPKTRAERKEEQKIADILYREYSTKYFLVITVLLVLLFKGLQPDSSMTINWLFYVLPGVVLFEALFQTIKEFHLFFGTVAMALIGFSIYSVGITVPHIVLILCVITGCPVLTFAGAASAGLWMLLSISNKLLFLDYLSKWDLGWILLIVVMLVVNRYFRMRIVWHKTTYVRAFLGTYIYDKISVVMTIAGVVLFVLQKCNVMVLPDIVGRMHFIRTGIISFVGMMIFAWWDGYLEDDIFMDEGRY